MIGCMLGVCSPPKSMEEEAPHCFPQQFCGEQTWDVLSSSAGLFLCFSQTMLLKPGLGVIQVVWLAQ